MGEWWGFVWRWRTSRMGIFEVGFSEIGRVRGGVLWFEECVRS